MKVPTILLLSILALLSALVYPTLISSSGESRSHDASTAPTGSESWTDEHYQSVLENVDQAGMVDYRDLKRDRESLDKFALQLSTLPRSTYDSWDDKSKISFWINAYNGLTLLAITDNYPIESSFLRSLRYPKNSIRQISGVWDSLNFQVMGQPITLEEIEHGILRAQFEEPRIHVALVCAAMGCPPLRNEPYEGSRLDEQLNDQANRFFGDPKKFRIDRGTNTVYLSRILDWFGEDFIDQYQKPGFRGSDIEEGAILEFAIRSVSSEAAEYLVKKSYAVEFLDYDWTLNEQVYD